MHKCEHKGCNKNVKNIYKFCFEHRNDSYMGNCALHGQVLFKKGSCLQCKKLRTPLYRLHKRNGQYYVGRSKKPLSHNYFLKPLYKPLLHPNRKYQRRYIKRVIKGPGVYGIFVRDKRCYKQLGRCLYVGQSTNIQRRISEHRNNVKIAAAHLRRLKINKNVHLIDKSTLKVPLLYYKLALHGVDNLKYTTLFGIDKKYYQRLNLKEALLCLTFFEQLEMDAYRPKYNVIAARPTDPQQCR